MRQSFTWWSFTFGRDDLDAEALLRAAADIGYAGVEMLPAHLRPAARDAGLALVTETGHQIEVGFNDPAHHRALHDEVGAVIDTAAVEGIEHVIVFAGSREGRTDKAGISACIDGLGPLAERASASGVTLLLELLNSKVDHPDHHCDRSWWGFEVVRRVAVPALRVLYDGYHMQLMEGDLSRTIKANLELIGHVHVAGVPGRHDLDDRQEVSWRAIAGLLRHLGYERWIGHELVPRSEPVAALRHGHGVFAE